MFDALVEQVSPRLTFSTVHITTHRVDAAPNEEEALQRVPGGVGNVVWQEGLACPLGFFPVNKQK